MKVPFAIAIFTLASASFGQLDFYEASYILEGAIRNGSGAGMSRLPVISPNGRYVSFSSTKTGLRANEWFLTQDIFVRNTASNGISSRNKHLGKQVWLGYARDPYGYPTAVLNDQSRTYFSSPDPIPGASTLNAQLYYYDNVTGNSVLVSAAADGAPVYGCHFRGVSDNGNNVLFQAGNHLYIRNDSESFSRLIQTNIVWGSGVISKDGSSVLFGVGAGLWRYRNGVKQQVLPNSATGKVFRPLWVDNTGTKAIVETENSLDPLDLSGYDLYQLDFAANTVKLLPRPNGSSSYRAVDVSSNGTYIAICPVSSRMAYVYDVPKNRWNEIIPKYRVDDYPESISIDDAGTNVVIGTWVGDVLLCNVALRTQSYLDNASYRIPAEDVSSFHVTPDERFAVFGSQSAFSDGKYRTVRRDLTTGADVIVPNNLYPLGLSDNGRYVLGSNGNGSVYFVDLKSGFTKSLGAAEQSSTRATMDRSGIYTTFESGGQIYLYDHNRNTEKLLSRTADGRASSGYAWCPKISADGMFVFFISTARDMPGGFQTGPASCSVFRWSRATDKTEVIQLPNPGWNDFNVSQLVTNATGSRIAYLLVVVSADPRHWPIFYDLTKKQARYLPEDLMDYDITLQNMDSAGEHILLGHEWTSTFRVMRYSDLRRGDVAPTFWYFDGGYSKGLLCNGRRLWALTGSVLLRGKYEFR
jgi:Tol biopolymer transport system component